MEYQLSMNQFMALSDDELFGVDGGKKTVSDWLLFGGALCACYVNPYVGVPLAVAVFLLT